MSSNSQSTLEENLSQICESLKRKDLREELADAATTLETIILLQNLEDELYGHDAEFDESLLQIIRQIQNRIKDGDVDALTEDVDTLQTALSKAKRQSRQRLNTQIEKDLDKLSAMKRLNNRVDKVDDARITALQQQFSDCQSLEFVSAESLEVKISEVERKTETIENDFNDLQQDVFGQFYGTSLEGSIRKLLNDEALRLDSLSMKEIRQLRESELADCLELVLS